MGGIRRNVVSGLPVACMRQSISGAVLTMHTVDYRGSKNQELSPEGSATGQRSPY